MICFFKYDRVRIFFIKGLFAKKENDECNVNFGNYRCMKFIRIGKTFLGREYATEASKTLLQFTFDEKMYHKVFACYFGSNPASGSVLQKISMMEEGILIDHIIKEGKYEVLFNTVSSIRKVVYIKMISILMKTLFHASPKMNFSQAEVAEYEALISGIHEGQLVIKGLTFPKYRFLQYLTLKEDFVFHGSNHVDIDIFEPREQTLFNGKLTKAVFASSEPNWSMFYAVFDRSKLTGGFRNGCLVYKDKKYHYYSLNKSTMINNPWTSGKIYILPKNKFTPSDTSKLRFDEWICHDPVRPVSQLEVSARDFYYINRVSTHKNNESIVKSWLLYKFRTLKAK